MFSQEYPFYQEDPYSPPCSENESDESHLIVTKESESVISKKEEKFDFKNLQKKIRVSIS